MGPDAGTAGPLDGHTAGNSLRILGTASSPFPGAPDRRALRPRPTSVPRVPPTTVPLFQEFVGTVHDPASHDCRIRRSSPTTKPEFPDIDTRNPCSSAKPAPIVRRNRERSPYAGLLFAVSPQFDVIPRPRGINGVQHLAVIVLAVNERHEQSAGSRA